MRSMLMKASSIIAALILSTCVFATSTQRRNSSFESFKREMMPKVGKKISVVGVLRSGKLGWLVTFKEWQVYIYAVGDSDIHKMNGLNPLDGHTVKATGTLRYFPPPPTYPDRIEAVPPEHFYFDVAEVKVTGLRKPRTKRSSRGESNFAKQRLSSAKVQSISCQNTSLSCEL